MWIGHPELYQIPRKEMGPQQRISPYEHNTTCPWFDDDRPPWTRRHIYCGQQGILLAQYITRYMPICLKLWYLWLYKGLERTEEGITETTISIKQGMAGCIHGLYHRPPWKQWMYKCLGNCGQAIKGSDPWRVEGSECWSSGLDYYTDSYSQAWVSQNHCFRLRLPVCKQNVGKSLQSHRCSTITIYCLPSCNRQID